MERDVELIRKIMIDVKSAPAGQRYTCIDLLIDDATDTATVLAHFDLLLDAGLLKGNVVKVMSGIKGVSIEGITWNGYEFIDEAVKDTSWKKLKTKLVSIGGSASFEVLNKLLVSIALDSL